jgi:hypothetical protein
MRCKGGYCHVPLRTRGCGRYMRRTTFNVFDTEGAGAGSQLDAGLWLYHWLKSVTR